MKATCFKCKTDKAKKWIPFMTFRLGTDDKKGWLCKSCYDEWQRKSKELNEKSNEN